MKQPALSKRLLMAAVIKQLSYSMPISQVLMLIGLGGVLIFGVTSYISSVCLISAEIVKPWFVVRTVSELASAIFFVIAIVYATRLPFLSSEPVLEPS